MPKKVKSNVDTDRQRSLRVQRIVVSILGVIIILSMILSSVYMY